MSVITAKGKAAKESANKKKVEIDFKKVFIKLKENESVKVRLLSSEDYVEYMAHGNYNLGIYTQPCLKPAGKKCAMCEASDAEVEGFDAIYAKKRYLFVFADIDNGMIRVFDATKGQAKGIIEQIEEYADDLGELAFNFKRTGTKTETSYTLNPIVKMKADDKAKFAAFDDAKVEDDFYETVLQARSYEQQIEELKQAGFPVGSHFNVEETETVESDAVPFDIDENDPTKGF
jgi:hypothetical protein